MEKKDRTSEYVAPRIRQIILQVRNNILEGSPTMGGSAGGFEFDDGEGD